MRRFLLGCLGALLLLGCSSGDDDDDDDDSAGGGGNLTCEWYTENNCYSALIAQAESCLPPEGETGVLSADGKSCTYASGASITFNRAVLLPLDIDVDTPWDFTVKDGAATCLTFASTNDDSQVTTVNDMTFRQDILGAGVKYTCPDGSTFSQSNALTLIACPDFFTSAPGYAWFSTDTSVSLSFLNGMGGSIQAFSCAR